MKFKPLELQVVEIFPENKTWIRFEYNGVIAEISPIQINDSAVRRIEAYYGRYIGWLAALRERSRDFRLVLTVNQYDRFNLYLKDTKTGKRFTLNSMFGDASNGDTFYTKAYLKLNGIPSI